MMVCTTPNLCYYNISQHQKIIHTYNTNKIKLHHQHQFKIKRGCDSLWKYLRSYYFLFLLLNKWIWVRKTMIFRLTDQNYNMTWRFLKNINYKIVQKQNIVTWLALSIVICNSWSPSLERGNYLVKIYAEQKIFHLTCVRPSKWGWTQDT